jgi:exosortase
MRPDSTVQDRKKILWGVPCSFVYALWAVFGFMAFTAWNQSHWWMLKDDYVFGWLVPLFAGYVVYERWPRVVALLGGKFSRETRERNVRVRFVALLAVVGGGIFFLFGATMHAAAGASYPASLALSLGTAGAVLGTVAWAAEQEGVAGWSVARVFVFPALVWLISAPMISAIENALSLFLLGKITSVVFFVFESLGMAIEQQGNVLVLPLGEVGVAEACSGIRSLMGCLFAGSFLGAMCFEQLWKKVTLLAAASVFALSMNLIRSLFLTGWAYEYGPEAIEGRFHDWTGFAVIGVTTLGLLGLTQMLNWKVSFRFTRS